MGFEREKRYLVVGDTGERLKQKTNNFTWEAQKMDPREWGVQHLCKSFSYQTAHIELDSQNFISSEDLNSQEWVDMQFEKSERKRKQEPARDTAYFLQKIKRFQNKKKKT